MVYIGARDQYQREYEAAQNAQDLATRGFTKEEAITAAAKEANLPEETISRTLDRGVASNQPQSYGYSPGKATTSNVVPDTKTFIPGSGGQVQTTYKAGTPEEIKEEQYKQANKARFFNQIKPEAERRQAAEQTGRNVAVSLFQKQNPGATVTAQGNKITITTNQTSKPTFPLAETSIPFGRKIDNSNVVYFGKSELTPGNILKVGYKETNERISKYTGLRFVGKYVNKIGAETVTDLERFRTKYPALSPAVKYTQFGINFTRGAIQEVTEKPLTIPLYYYGGKVLKQGLSYLPKVAPGLGKAINKKSTSVLIGSIYAGSVALETARQPTPEQKTMYLGSEAVKIISFTRGYKSGATTTAKKDSAQLTKDYAGKTVRDIARYDPQKYSLQTTTTDLSTEIRLKVKDLTGMKAVRESTVTNGKYLEKGYYQPIYGKERFISMNDILSGKIKQPDLAVLEITTTRTGKGVMPQPVIPNTKVKAGDVALYGSRDYDVQTKKTFLLNQRGLKKLSEGAFYVKELPAEKGLYLKEFGVAQGKFSGFDFSRSRDIIKVKPTSNYAKAPGETYTKLPGSMTNNKLGYTYQIAEYPDYFYKPVITESGIALGSRRIDLKALQQGVFKEDFITAGIGKTKRANPFNLPTRKPVSDIGTKIEIGEGSGSVLIQIQKVDVKVKPTLKSVSKVGTTTILGTKQEQQSKQQTQQQTQTRTNQYKVNVGSEDIIKSNIITLNRFKRLGQFYNPPVSKSDRSYKSILDVKNDVIKQQTSNTQQEMLSLLSPKMERISILDTPQVRDIATRQNIKYMQINQFKSDSFLRDNTKPERRPKIGYELLKKNDEKRNTAYKVLVKEGNIWRRLESELPRGKALQAGASYVSQNLRASFKLLEAGTTNIPDIVFRPDPNIFRNYRIKGGKRVYEQDLFIQREGKRLSSGGEVREIQDALVKSYAKKKWRM